MRDPSPSLDDLTPILNNGFVRDSGYSVIVEVRDIGFISYGGFIRDSGFAMISDLSVIADSSMMEDSSMITDTSVMADLSGFLLSVVI